MKRLAEFLFGLQKGERGTALLLAAYHFLLLLCLYLLKPVRDGLFITDRGTAELPLVFMLVAAATVPAGLFQRWLGRHYAHDRLTNRLTVGLVGVLLTVSGLAWADVPGGAYAVYVYVSIYGVLATSQFWLFAGGLLTSAQSKRTFALLNLGGILGAVMGGELTGWLVHHLEVGAGAVLSIAAGLLLATIPLVAGIRRYHASTEGGAPEASGERKRDRDRPSGDGVDRGAWERFRQTLRTYPLVGWIAALVALVSMVSTVLDYQLKTIAAASLAGEADLTAFLGRFYGRVSLVAFALQLILSTRLRRYVRSTTVLWILPLAIALGTTALLIVPGLLTVTLLRGADQSLKHSIDKTGRELLFLPLPQAVKRRLKVPLDLVVDQVAYGVGGLLLLGLVSGIGLSAVALGPVVLVLVALWGGALIGARRQYLQQFRDVLRGAVSPSGSLPEPSDDERKSNAEPTTPSSDRSLAAGRETAIRHGARYVLVSQMLALQTGGDPPSGDTVDRSELPPESALRAQRRMALDALFDVLADWVPEAQAADAADLRLALEALHQSSDDVRSDAVSFLDGVLSGSLRRRLVPLLDDPDGHLALQNAPPVYRFAIPEFTPTEGTRFAHVPPPNRTESADVSPLPTGGPERRRGGCVHESEGRPPTRTMPPGSRS